ncbi:uncharacterized protein G2W53_016173 [Senna tora]|uniref:Uncharacterized protein n=1 Tax=Senna tora TaxID=362788 RepID=A0A834WW45_9FABA|nr:uncharacterized protein G2W53_016173 [Senna tora]
MGIEDYEDPRQKIQLQGSSKRERKFAGVCEIHFRDGKTICGKREENEKG